MMKTLIMLIFLGYVIDVDPGPMLIVQPSESDADSFSKERIAPMLRDVPAVTAKVHESKSRSSGNTILQKRFRGGSVSLTGAISPLGLRRRSVRYLLLDEVDGYHETSDGDPITLAAARTSKFWNRKLVLCSTPTIEGASRIARAFEESDQRYFLVPCPECHARQRLVWSGVRWGDINGTRIDPADAHYQCSECGFLIPHHRKLEMLRGGQWVASNPAGRFPGFSISRLYAPDWPWGRIVTDPLEGFLVTKEDPVKFRAFVNNVLAETWKESGDAPDWEKLMSRREDAYRLGQAPDGALFLTAGVDVQKTWMQGHVWGWGRGRQRWLVDRWIIECDPYGQEAWELLTERLNAQYRRLSGGSLSIVRMAVDSGYAAQEVYRWTRQQGPGRAMAVKGMNSGAALVSTPQRVEVSHAGKAVKHGARVYIVNVSMAKSELYGLLAKDRPADGEPFPAGWVHFPSDVDDEFFRQLTAEHLVSHVVKGYRKHEWVKTRERNEDLDCCNYARAAASVFGVDRFSEHRWREMEAGLVAAAVTDPEELEPFEPQPVEAPRIAPVARQPEVLPGAPGWFGGRKGWFQR